MKDVNKVILIGRLGADPIQRETKSGTVLVQLSLATSRMRKDLESLDPEAKVEETQWHRIVVWGKLGELCVQHLRKGQTIYVEGSMRSRKYEAKDGTTRFIFEVHAENVLFLNGAKRRLEEVEEEGVALATPA